MRVRSAAVFLASCALGLSLVGCARYSTDVTNVVVAPVGAAGRDSSSQGTQPYPLASGVGGLVRVFFRLNFDPVACTLTLDGVRQLQPVRTMAATTVTDYETFRHYFVEYETAGLAPFRAITGSLTCHNNDRPVWGEPAATSKFTVASRPIILAEMSLDALGGFSTVQVGREERRFVRLRNSGGLAFMAFPPSFAGSDAFAVSSDTCAGYVVKSLDSCGFWVQFRPSLAGSHETNMTVQLRSTDAANADEVTVVLRLTGHAVAAPPSDPPPDVPPHHPPVG